MGSSVLDFSQRKPSLRVMRSLSIINTKDMVKKPRNATAVRTIAVDGKTILTVMVPFLTANFA